MHETRDDFTVETSFATISLGIAEDGLALFTRLQFGVALPAPSAIRTRSARAPTIIVTAISTYRAHGKQTNMLRAVAYAVNLHVLPASTDFISNNSNRPKKAYSKHQQARRSRGCTHLGPAAA